MTKIIISRYDVAEHLRTTEEMAAYLDACIEGSRRRCSLHSQGAW